MNPSKSKLLVLALFILCSIEGNYAQSLTLPSNGYTNTIGSAISGGLFIDKDAIFYGFSIDYSKVILQNWIVNISLAYDKEINTQTKQDIPDINSYTPSIALGYAFNQKTAIGIGLGKSIFDDDNEDNKIQFNKNGGWTIGLIGVYSFYQKGQHSFDISGGIERGLTVPETDLTLEFGYGFSY